MNRLFSNVFRCVILKKHAVYGFIFFFMMLFGCSSPYYNIREQSSPDLSLLIIKVAIPDNFSIVSSLIRNDSDETYDNMYVSSISDNIRSKILVFENLPEGKYRLKKVLAETDKSYSVKGNTTRTSWQGIYVQFADPGDKPASDRDGWFTVSPGTVVFGGDVQWVTDDEKEKFLANLAVNWQKSKSTVQAGIIGKYSISIGSNKGINTVPGFLFRHDHPQIIGEKSSLENEAFILKTILKDTSEKTPLWSKLITKRLQEISIQLSSQQGSNTGGKKAKK